MQTAWGAGGGATGYLGPVKAGVSGYTVRGMDGFQFLTFNPIFVGQGALTDVPDAEIEIGRLPPPPLGAEIDRVEVIIRLRRTDGGSAG